MTEIVPAIIPHTKEQIEEEIRKIVQFAPKVQIDISDGIFVPTKTWPYNERDKEFFDGLITESVGWPRWEEIEIEVHLMVKNPETVILDWIHTGASALVIHIEATDDFQKIIDICKDNNISLGIAIKPSTDILRIDPFVSQVDFIQCMGSDLLGKHGVPLEPKALDQIKEIHALYPTKMIAVDIGVDEDTAEILVSLGATKLISGGAILDSDNPEETYRNMEAIS